jgi:hypothetical protein
MKERMRLIILIWVIILFPGLAFSQVPEERLVITTYYPSPNGSYNELGANKLAVDIANVATPAEYAAMQNGDAHIGRSLILGAEVTGLPINSWSYRHLSAVSQLPNDGDLRMKGSLFVGADRLNFPAKVFIRSTGNTSATHAIEVENNDPTTPLTLMRLSDDGSMGINGLPGNMGQLTIYGKDSTNSWGALFVTNSNGDNLFRIRNDGNIGIGTNNPTAKLSLDGGDNDAIFRIQDTSATGGTNNFYFQACNNSGRIVNSAGVGIFLDGDNNDVDSTVETAPFTIAHNQSSYNSAPTPNNYLMVVTELGQTVVGSTSSFPHADLEVAKDGPPARWSRINAGESAWTSSSSRKIKENIAPLKVNDILEKISKVQVFTYDFKKDGRKSKDDSGRKNKIGLMAEDFHNVFQRGPDDAISGQEVEMALWLAVQELIKENKTLSTEIQALKKKLR